MKRYISFAMIALLIIALCSCAQQDLANMTTGDGDGYGTIVWGDRIYVPYGPLSAYCARGKQIGILDGNKDDKVYKCKGYSADEWIVSTLPYDAAMLWREIKVADIPEGWQSEYEWNN